MKRVLIVVDVQKDYFPGGRNELVNVKEAALKIKELIETFRAKSEPVIYIQHINNYVGADFFLEGTDGIDISEMVTPLNTDIIVKKHYPNSFLETSLQEHLDKLSSKELVICGMMTHMCIDTTVRAAKALKYDITLIEDACATKDLVWNQERIPAYVVQETYMSSLSNTFAKICKAKEIV